MNRLALFPVLLLAGAWPAAAQLTMEQKLFDFQTMAAAYDKYYTPYEWKKRVFGFDLLDIAPWLARVRATRDDLAFFEVCSNYVAALNDAHSSYSLPSSFSASLGISLDVYDGKVLIDGINRTRLPETRYPFQIGDELVSVDGRTAEELLKEFDRYTFASNPRSRRRQAAALIASRSQARNPRAHEIADAAQVSVRRAGGEEETYSIPWVTSGTPFTTVGPVPSPFLAKARRPAAAEETDDYMAPLMVLRRDIVEFPPDLLNMGSLAPVWRLPTGFQQRLGRATGDFFFSGVIPAEGLRIGYIRVPTFAPSSTAAALRQFEDEIAWFQRNTEGLVVDVMRNGGGDSCYAEEMERRLIPYRFRAMGRLLRATRYWVNAFSNALEQARARRAEQWQIDLLEARLKDVRTAYQEQRGTTGPLPVCSAATLDRDPAEVVYTKPLMVLIDEFSVSAADGFPAIMQDAQRGPMFGMRTMGAGGTVISLPVHVFAEATASVTIAMHFRKQPIVTEDYPAANYVENIGVRPDIPCDYMTRENLMTGGKAFTDAFIAAMVQHIRGVS